ncbi:MAG: uracil-DNA glycosylase [Spirochaetota bacterium]|nr:MAG: uracil-DNA glycosylase [Spirochaetota bacterium]
MANLVDEILKCTQCTLHEGRRNAVPGEGNIDADIVFIGEGPGEMEDIKGRPFVGRAGQLLTKMLAAINLRREEVYITNVVKCRPPENRTPLPEEVRSCLPYLKKQISYIDPSIICCLGGPAINTLLNSQSGISKLRGTFHQYNGPHGEIPVIATYHPAAVLRFPDKYRRPVWNDLKLLRDYYSDIRANA